MEKIKRNNWTREQLLVAFYLYWKLPFGKLDQHNPEIIKYAEYIGRTPGALALKLVNIASLDPEITGTGRSGMSNASQADKDMWQEMEADRNGFAENMMSAVSAFSSERPMADGESIDYGGYDELMLVKVRQGQGLFRQAVLSAYDFKCCITGLSVPRLLIASHIKPWRDDEENRLNPSNGLALNTLHDRAFDAGLITIDDDMKVVISENMEAGSAKQEFYRQALLKYHGHEIALPGKFRPDRDFLRYHREHIFEK